MAEFKGFDDWIEIFKGGRQVDSTGREHDGDALIDKALAGFDPGRHEPPGVIGHPQADAPAYAWVEDLKKENRGGTNFLLAKFKDVVPEFAAMVEQGLFRKRSASFYRDGTLRHVGFLGAAPPAVKGLANLAFDDGEEAALFEFAATDEEKAAQQARAGKYKIAVKAGGHVTKPAEWRGVPDDRFLDPVNYRYPCPDADQTRAAASYWGRPANRAQYSTPEQAIINKRLDNFRRKFKIGAYRKEAGMSGFREKFTNFLSFMGVDVSKIPDDALPADMPEGVKAGTFSEADLQAAAKAAEEKGAEKARAEFAERQKEERKKVRAKEIKDFCAKGIEGGTIAPAWMDAGLAEFMEALEAEASIDFGENKGKKTTYAWFVEFMQGLPKLIHFGEIAKRDKDINAGSAGTKLNTLIREKMSKDRKLTYNAAFAEVQIENPTLAEEYLQDMAQ